MACLNSMLSFPLRWAPTQVHHRGQGHPLPACCLLLFSSSVAFPRYITEGKDILSQLRTGDVIQSAAAGLGGDRLVIPGSESAATEEAEALAVSES